MSQSKYQLISYQISLYFNSFVAATGDGQWPPRSPHDVLLSTPGGRERLRRLANRTSPSPSPVKRSNYTPSLQNQNRNISESTLALKDLGDEDDDDEDEETLRLQLQAIEARLKLKRLQKAKIKDGSKASDTEKETVRGGAALLTRTTSATANRPHQGNTGSQRQRLESADSQESIHVPVSPIRRVQSTEPARSPGRVLLGIDKGLKGRDVSLRRAPSLRQASDEQMAHTKPAGGYLQRANSQSSTHNSFTSRSQSSLDDKKQRTFSERMADVRNQEADRREKDARIKRVRSKAFDIDVDEMEIFKNTAAALPDIKLQSPEFSRDEIVSSYGKPTGGILQRSKSSSAIPSGTRTTSDSSTISTATANSSTVRPSSRAKARNSPVETPLASSEFESFSSLHLSKRIIPHNVLTRTLAGKKTFTIPELFKVVVAPNFRLPDVEEDIVLLAIIASKSEPRQHKAKTTNDERGKYMVMTLVDLKWELELFLFNSGFDKFWKLTPGTVIAILNPNIMPPMKADTGRFSVTLTSSEDTVLELGTARDLGFCKTVKKDGKTCDAWIDKRHTEYCDFHVNEALQKTIAGRMEVNTMNFGKKRGGGSAMYGARKFNSTVVREWTDPAKKEPLRYDRETHSKIYIAPSVKGGMPLVGGPGRSTADMLDDEDVDPDAFHRGTNKQERMRRQLATAEKERGVAQKLGRIGGGLGADYLRLREQPTPESSSTIDEPPEPPDAKALGLLGGQAKDVHLGPIKRKRAGTSTPTNSSAVGWGSHLTKELGRMKDGERLQPVKKKTRFITAKGIREAGRESFGGDVPPPGTTVNDNDDDEDDLDIIR
jgi:minichromosome maintenance protein 10